MKGGVSLHPAMNSLLTCLFFSNVPTLLASVSLAVPVENPSSLTALNAVQSFVAQRVWTITTVDENKMCFND